MKVIIADTYMFYIHNSKNTRFPKKYRNYKILWNMRDALFELWSGKIKEIVIPKLGTPGYDFVEFIDCLVTIGQIKEKPKVSYYELDITKKS